jgi:hypothetical protein
MSAESLVGVAGICSFKDFLVSTAHKWPLNAYPARGAGQKNCGRRLYLNVGDGLVKKSQVYQ